jgi:hypothetical protein
MAVKDINNNIIQLADLSLKQLVELPLKTRLFFAEQSTIMRSNKLKIRSTIERRCSGQDRRQTDMPYSGQDRRQYQGQDRRQINPYSKRQDRRLNA